MSIKICLKNQCDEVLASGRGETHAWLGYKDYYEDGYTITVTCNGPNNYLAIKFDATKDETFVFVPDSEFTYDIELYPQRSAFPSTAMKAWRNYASARYMNEEEISRYKNLALNTHDRPNFYGAYPHASANIETRNESNFFALNAIDGIYANDDHGAYPFASWGINQDPNAEFSLEFGRKVYIDKLGFILRGDYPHDSYWTEGTVEFSDGTSETFEFKKVLSEQQFEIEPRVISGLKFNNLIKHEDDSPFPALTQILVYGTEFKEEDHQ